MSEILFLSHTHRSGEFRVGSHHLSTALARAGHKVAHVSTPYSFPHAVLKRDQISRRQAAQRGSHLTEGVVDLVPRSLLPADWIWTPAQTRRIIRRVGLSLPDYVFVDQPLFRLSSIPSACVIFRPTDVFRGRRAIRAADAAAHCADAVVATSPGVLASLDIPASCPTRVIENGVEYKRFASSSSTKEVDFVYVGAIDFRFDFDALIMAAKCLPGSTFEVYGPLQVNSPSLPANVELRGPVAYEDVPNVLSRARVGIMPFRVDPANVARSPMKLYEYIAAGLRVVAPEPIASRADELRSVFAYNWADPSDFSRAASVALGSPPPGDSDREAAASRDWSLVAARLMEFAASVSAGESGSIVG